MRIICLLDHTFFLNRLGDGKLVSTFEIRVGIQFC